MPFALFDVVTPTGAAVVVFATIISHFARQANKSHARTINFLCRRAFTSNLDFPIGTRIGNWSYSNNAMQYKERNKDIQRERERAQCACMTGTINFLLQLYYNRDSLLWEISISCCCWSCAAAAVAVVVALLFFLLCAYNSWFTARSYCSWLCATMQHIEIFIYQHIY